MERVLVIIFIAVADIIFQAALAMHVVPEHIQQVVTGLHVLHVLLERTQITMALRLVHHVQQTLGLLEARHLVTALSIAVPAIITRGEAVLHVALGLILQVVILQLVIHALQEPIVPAVRARVCHAPQTHGPLQVPVVATLSVAVAAITMIVEPKVVTLVRLVHIQRVELMLLALLVLRVHTQVYLEVAHVPHAVLGITHRPQATLVV
jgi:hypothetical protein